MGKLEHTNTNILTYGDVNRGLETIRGTSILQKTHEKRTADANMVKYAV